jgi:4-amino-4-deoxy-L-arabinose transferase-like glycosyltransferase
MITVARPVVERGRSREPLAICITWAGIVSVAAVLRLAGIGGKPGWQWDEVVYSEVASNLLHHGVPYEHIPLGQPFAPDAYQPAAYFWVLAGWFRVAGAGVPEARVLGALASLMALGLVSLAVYRVYGHLTAMIAAAAMAVDGWLVFIQRIGYIENFLLLVIAAFIACYERRRIVLAGALAGAAFAVKYTGIIAPVTYLAVWLITGRDHRRHLAGLASMTLSFVAVTGITVLTDGWRVWEQATSVQIERVLGIQSSGGTLTSPTAALHLMIAQYWVFLPSLVVATAGGVILVRLVWRCYRARDFVPAEADALFAGWGAAGVLIMAASSLRFPQYFALTLIPLYVLAWSRVTRMKSLPKAVAVTGAVLLASVASVALRVALPDDNVLASIRQYAAVSIPESAVVVADEQVGDEIGQPYCREQDATPCLGKASYVVTWDTYLQQTQALGDAAFARIFGEPRTAVASWEGWNGDITVWKLTP